MEKWIDLKVQKAWAEHQIGARRPRTKSRNPQSSGPKGSLLENSKPMGARTMGLKAGAPRVQAKAVSGKRSPPEILEVHHLRNMPRSQLQTCGIATRSI
ncbi:hypothetical protein FA15DRAFT_414845 [Coprinopsis marcescibilis]|uniref:Uncharacterized protein n=1 Tax=Coprinopsis marcescibilis TaxID=230819 RepID=A0A5C3L857_COPMA|nr:hypothetical protein FA15DRAFT_414845 [Coprinopsis marcescibilis]